MLGEVLAVGVGDATALGVGDEPLGVSTVGVAPLLTLSAGDGACPVGSTLGRPTPTGAQPVNKRAVTAPAYNVFLTREP